VSLPFDDRRSWFQEHTSRVTCPCCGYPTLTKQGDWEICELCNWEDGGGDDWSLDSVSGANGQYSLREARANFEKYGIMYGPEKGDMRGASDSPEVAEAKRKLIEGFELLMQARNPKDSKAGWKSIQFLEKELQRKAYPGSR
jgi:hypothetical protein